jgi:hypothetical protein
MENLTLGTSQTYTNDPINNTGGDGTVTPLSLASINYKNTGTAQLNHWSELTRLQVNELNDSIEMIYEETPNIALSVYPPRPPEKRYFKIIFSCVDGKWNKSERIYGKKIEREEYFEFKDK